MLILTLAALLSGGAAVAAAADACDRTTLQAAADSYIAAQVAGTPMSIADLSSSVIYTESNKTMDISEGVLSHALKIDHKRTILDTTACTTYTELIATDAGNPRVIGTQIRLADGNITSIETLAATTGDWLFNATNTLLYSQVEDAQAVWDPIPEDMRDSREVIQAAADAYLDLFFNATVVVPFGSFCSRLEGGTYFMPCNYGVPENITISARRYVVDEVYGTVDVFDMFMTLPDTHEFRIENGTIKHVHAITIGGV